MNFTFTIQNSSSSIGDGSRQEFRLVMHPSEDPKDDRLCGGIRWAHVYMDAEGKLRGRISVASIIPSWVASFQAAFPLVEVYTSVSRPEILQALGDEITDWGANARAILASESLVGCLHEEAVNLGGNYRSVDSDDPNLSGLVGYLLGLPVIQSDRITTGWALV